MRYNNKYNKNNKNNTYNKNNKKNNKKNSKRNKNISSHSPNYTQTHIATYYQQPDNNNPKQYKLSTHMETQPHNTHLYSTLQYKINKYDHSPINKYNH
jgi:hypothetical protein